MEKPLHMIFFELTEELEKIKNEIFDGKISWAIKHIENNYLKDYPDIQTELDEIKNTYRILLDYFSKNTEDPQREEIIKKTKFQLAQIVDIIREKKKIPLAQNHPENIYSFFNSKIDLNSLLSLLSQNHETIDNVFIHIILTNRFDANIESNFLELIENSELPIYYKHSLIGALNLSIIRFYDNKKMQILLKLFKSDDIETKIRAACAIIIALMMHYKAIKNSNLIYSQIKLLEDDETFMSFAPIIIIQLIKSLETESIITEFQEQIIPKMNQLNTKLKKLGIEDPNEELSDEENPLWKKLTKGEKEIFKKLEEMTEKILEGSDVLSATLGSLKRFSFFEKIHNWFVSYNPQNHELEEALYQVSEKSRTKFLNTLQKAFYICNLDKYSLCLFLTDMPTFMAKETIKILSNEISRTSELENEINKEANNEKYRIIHYIQDLYRFYHFDHYHRGIRNFFQTGEIKRLVFLIETFPSLHDTFLEAVDILIEIKRFNYAIEYLHFIIKNTEEPDAMLFEKLGFCYHKNDEPLKALEFYKKAELFEYDKKWLNWRMGLCLMDLQKFDEALEYFKKLETEEPNNFKILKKIATCLLETNKFEDALKVLLKIDYYYPDNLNVSRLIAFASLMVLKFDLTRKYISKCLKEPVDSDYILLGNLELLEKNNIQAALKNYLIYAKKIKDPNLFIEKWQENIDLEAFKNYPKQILELIREYILMQM